MEDPLFELLPESLRSVDDLQTAIPRLARDEAVCVEVEEAVRLAPSRHQLHLGDATRISFLADQSVDLVVTSPPYWTLKEYNDVEGQLGYVADYREFLDRLDEVWRRCYHALVPGGRLICVVGDVCLSRRQNGGRHTVVPLHASIQERCREIGFDNLAPIIWHKIANVSHEVDRGGGGFLGKPYEPNAVIKNDIEFVLMLRKPGGYRQPTPAKRLLSLIPAPSHREWFQQVWTGVTGASTKEHPAPYPVTLAERLVRMFSFVGDTVLDPFLGTGTTAIACSRCGRSSIGVEIDSDYYDFAERRLTAEANGLFSNVVIESDRGEEAEASGRQGEKLSCRVG